MDFSMKFLLFSLVLYGAVTIFVKVLEKRKNKASADADVDVATINKLVAENEKED